MQIVQYENVIWRYIWNRQFCFYNICKWCSGTMTFDFLLLWSKSPEKKKRNWYHFISGKKKKKDLPADHSQDIFWSLSVFQAALVVSFFYSSRFDLNNITVKLMSSCADENCGGRHLEAYSHNCTFPICTKLVHSVTMVTADAKIHIENHELSI